MNGFLRDLIEKCLDMRVPFLFGLRRNEAVNECPRVDCLGSRCIDGAEHKIDAIVCAAGLTEDVARLLSPSLQVVGCGGRHLNFDAFDAALFPLPLSVSTHALYGCPIGHRGLLADDI